MASNNAYGPQIVTDGLVVCLDANNAKSYPGAGTTWYGLTPRGYNGAIQNGATLSTAGAHKYFSFDGTNDDVDIGPISTSAEFSECSISIWFTKGSQNETYGNLFDCNYGITALNKGPRMEVDVAGAILRLYLAADDGTYYAGYTDGLSNDTWYNVVWTIKTPVVSPYQIVTSYVNGLQHYAVSPAGSAYIWDGDIGDLYLGVGFTSGRNFTGNIAIFHVYNRVLSLKEIKQNYNANRSRFGL